MKTVCAKNRAEWRAWLDRNSQKFDEIWLMYYKKATGKDSVAYAEAVEEALCVGWIDGKIKRIDQERYAQRFTPRRAASGWSASNIARARRLIQEGRMTPAGLAVFDLENPKKVAALPTELPIELERRFAGEAGAWDNFNRFPPSYRRMAIGWVASAKKDETRLKRLEQLIASSVCNARIKFM